VENSLLMDMGDESCLQEEKYALAASRDNLDRLYRDANNSLTILERSHRFTMADLDNHRYKLQEYQDELIRVRHLVSSKDSVIKDLRASKRSVVQELEAARLAVRAGEDTSTTLKAQHDKAMDKAIRAGRILMRRPGVIVLEIGSMCSNILLENVLGTKRYYYFSVV
jgi:chromosome segregation ATPase